MILALSRTRLIYGKLTLPVSRKCVPSRAHLVWIHTGGIEWIEMNSKGSPFLNVTKTKQWFNEASYSVIVATITSHQRISTKILLTVRSLTKGENQTTSTSIPATNLWFPNDNFKKLSQTNCEKKQHVSLHPHGPHWTSHPVYFESPDVASRAARARWSPAAVPRHPAHQDRNAPRPESARRGGRSPPSRPPGVTE